MAEDSGAKTGKMVEGSGAKEMQNGRRFGRKRDAKWQKIPAQKRCKMADDSGAKEFTDWEDCEDWESWQGYNIRLIWRLWKTPG
jgi:hypothetical protein